MKVCEALKMREACEHLVHTGQDQVQNAEGIPISTL